MNAWASGGVVPAAMHGSKLAGLMAVWDAYATFAALAGADVTDRRAAAAGLPPVDSIDLWPYLAGKVHMSPRRQIEIGSTTCEQPATAGCINKWGWGDVQTIVQRREEAEERQRALGAALRAEERRAFGG